MPPDRPSPLGELRATVTGLFVGRAWQRWEGRPPSAIGKSAARVALDLCPTGFDRDEQADLTVHGGVDKVVHHYAADHHPFWRDEVPGLADRIVPGCFGENVSTCGIVESDLCIGDVLGLGTATVQVSQGRQPCWKLNANLDERSMAARFQRSGRVGWYYRVIETGRVGVGDPIELRDRPQPNWPLDVVIAARFDPHLDRRRASVLSRVTELAESWRTAFARKASSDAREDTKARLKG